MRVIMVGQFFFLGLVKLSSAPWERVAAKQHLYAGLGIQIRGAPSWDQGFQILKVPAHVDPESLPPLTHEWYLAIGNDLADRYAKKGALSLAQPSGTERQNWADEAAALRRYLLYAVQALMLFPRIAPTKEMRSQFDKNLRQEGFITGAGAARQLLPCPPLPQPPFPGRTNRRAVQSEPAPPAQCHQWNWKSTRWVCEVCLKFARGEARPAASAAPCPGHNAAFTELARNPRMHTIHLSNY